MTLSRAASAWDESGAAAAAASARASGLGITADQLEQLGKALAKANGTRKVRLLDRAQVIEAIGSALADPHGVGVVHGGEANVGEQRTTLCLAYFDRASSAMTVGVGLSRARSAGPSVTWKEL